MSDRDPSSLAARLQLDLAGPALFRSDPGHGPEGRPSRLFGGLVAAQALLAAGHGIRRGVVHSLHGYFLRPARHGQELLFEVEPTRDGYDVSSRRVVVRQAGEPVFHVAASFHVEQGGIAHQEPMPGVALPAELPAGTTGPERLPPWLGEVFEIRFCEADSGDFQLRAWLRPRQALPQADPLLHAAALVYASDVLMLGAAARGHIPAGRPGRGASLDHSAWFHGELRFDGWLLCDIASPTAHSGRALSLGAFYSPDGRRLATMAQEGLLFESGR